MARSRRSEVIHIGVGSHVVAIQTSSGEELWRTKLKGTSYVTLHRDGDLIFAGASGELWCLDASNGEIRWHNKLKGLGLGLVTFTSSDPTSAASAATAAATTAATTAAV